MTDEFERSLHSKLVQLTDPVVSEPRPVPTLDELTRQQSRRSLATIGQLAALLATIAAAIAIVAVLNAPRDPTPPVGTSATHEPSQSALPTAATTTHTPQAPTRSCPIVEPHELPDGAPVGERSELADGDRVVYVWGAGSDQVSMAIGEIVAVAGELDANSPYLTAVRGQPAAVTEIGEVAEAETAISWTAEDGCAYTIWIRGLTLEEVRDYARRY